MSVGKTQIKCVLSLENAASKNLTPLPSTVEVSEIMFSDNIARIRVFLGFPAGDIITDIKEESEHIQAPSNLLLFSQEKPSAILSFFKGKNNEPLTKDVVIKKAKAFCAARQHYFLQCIKLFKTGSNADIEQYCMLIGVGAIITDKLKIAKVEIINEYQTFYNFYTQIFNLLNNDKCEAAFLECYKKQIRVQDFWNVFKQKNEVTYEFKRNNELSNLIEMVKFLRPYMSVLFFQKIEGFYTYENLFHDLETYQSTFEISKYIIEQEKLLHERFSIFKNIFCNDTVLPDSYKKTLILKIRLLKKEWDSIIAKFRAIKEPDKRQFEEFVQILKLVDKIQSDIKIFSETVTDASQKLRVLKAKIFQIQQEAEQYLKEFTQQITEVFNSPAGNCDLFRRQKERSIQQEFDAIQFACKQIKTSLDTISFEFNGENSEMLTQVVQDVAEQTVDLKAEGLLFVTYVKKMSEDLYGRKQAHAAAIEITAKTKEEENEKMIIENRKVYNDKTQQHKATVTLNRQTKEKLKEEKRRLEAAKKLELAKSKDAKESKDLKEISEAQLKDLELNNTQVNLLTEIFSEPTPHHKIYYQEVVNLIKALGGEIESQGGSHRHIKIICLQDIIGFADYQEDNAKLSEIENPVATASGTLVKPHGKSHNPGTLSQFAVKQFRDVLERAGIRPTMATLRSTAAAPVVTASAGITKAFSKKSSFKK